MRSKPMTLVICTLPRTTMSELLGVVLCGGESSRMGSDKGLLVANGQTWAERAADLLHKICPSVAYSVNSRQSASYAATISGGEFITDAFSNMGPLGGLLSVHKKYPEADLLLLACDMLSVTEEDLPPLLRNRKNVAAYLSADLFEPLCAYYPAAACTKIMDLIQKGNISPSLQKILHLPELSITPLTPSNPDRLRSRNTL